MTLHLRPPTCAVRVVCVCLLLDFAPGNVHREGGEMVTRDRGNLSIVSATPVTYY